MGADYFAIHHADEDHENNDPNNLRPVHTKCHNTFHKIGKKISVQHRAKLIEGGRRWWASRTDEQKMEIARRMGVANGLAIRSMSADGRKKRCGNSRGKKLSLEHKAKISAAISAWWAGER